MTMQPGWVPPGTDTGKANVARVYDWWLGGTHNFRADQDAARAMIAVEPNARAIARANRAFLGRAVRFLAVEAGIRQFLDIGSGIPTQDNVHQVAHDAAPGARVLYADTDDVAVAHSKLILDGNPDAAVIQADLRDPASILSDPETQLLLDFSQPVGLLLVAVLHFLADADGPEQILATLRDALPPGSYLVVSHACSDPRPDLLSSFETAYKSRIDTRGRARTRAEITRFFDGFTLIDPGLVWAPQWRPDSPQDVPEDPEKYWFLSGVGKLLREDHMPRQIIRTGNAPSSPLYSQGVKAGSHVFVSGLVGIDPGTGSLAGDTIQAQTRQALANCQAVLQAGGASLEDVVEVGVLLTNPADFAGLNEEYGRWFPADPPARYVAKLGVELPGVLVSIRMTAVRD